MEEELNENELEERFYSMLHYVDETQANVISSQNTLSLLDNAPQSTVRRYWRPSEPPREINPYQKINTPKEAPKTQQKVIPNDKTKPKEEKSEIPPEPLPLQLSLFQNSIPQNLKNSIEIIENDDDSNIVELQSSDEDEVVEVALPPKPTITIESSDEDESGPQCVSKSKPLQDKLINIDREVSASPVPSVVSSVSDEFIRGDCIALNISSKQPDNHSLDFSVHTADNLGHSTPKKKKRKKNREVTSSPIIIELTPDKSVSHVEECFATPKSKAKNKRQKNKSYTVSAKSVPNADVYDSDSNQSIIDLNKSKNSYVVTDNSLPSIDVYDSDSNASESSKNNDKPKRAKSISIDIESGDSSEDKQNDMTKVTARNNSIAEIKETTITIVNLTDNTPSFRSPDIHESIVIGNVSGFTESTDNEDDRTPNDVTKLGSTKVPAILYENLDFDNLKGKDKVCKNRRYSLTSLRADMEKFYNESWGGEDFNHREIQKYMSRDKSLWAIDPKDRMPALSKRKPPCNYCNRAGHRDDMCRFKPPVCYMCGSAGHIEPRCPSKICVNCGSPNHVYSTMCRNCCTWGRIKCATCGQTGHPSSHCPDLWRRYHNTVDFTTRLDENRFTKKHYQLFCSGCTRRGHLVHTCNLSLPFSGLPINSPYVHFYYPIYPPPSYVNPQNNLRNRHDLNKSFPQDSTVSSATSRCASHKRQSKSPTVHEGHMNKRRNTITAEPTEAQWNTKSPVTNRPQRKMSQSKDLPKDTDQTAKEVDKNTVAVSEIPVSTTPTIEKAPDFIPIVSTNRDKKGQVIQDNEVSDTSDVVTSARIYITSEIIDKLKTEDGAVWLKETTEKHSVTLENTDINSFLSIKGKVIDQEAFQFALRDWIKVKTNNDQSKSDSEGNVTRESENNLQTQSLSSHNIPKNRNNVLRKLSKALDSLKEDLGEPTAIYKELTYLQNRHQQLLKQKIINPKQLSNNRDNMNDVLKKLNMVLLGQAGLADGSKHLSELYSLQERLINFRQKNIPIDLRKEIGLHYHCIFTPIPRADYGELLQSYYTSKQSPSFKKKKKEKSIIATPKKKTFNIIPSQQKNRSSEHDAKGGGDIVESKSSKFGKPLVEKTMNKLVFYHRRILQARPIDAVLKKTRVELVRKLHSHIAALGRNGNMSSKSLKKIKKSQERAQLFLNNV